MSLASTGSVRGARLVGHNPLRKGPQVVLVTASVCGDLGVDERQGTIGGFEMLF